MAKGTRAHLPGWIASAALLVGSALACVLLAGATAAPAATGARLHTVRTFDLGNDHHLTISLLLTDDVAAGDVDAVADAYFTANYPGYRTIDTFALSTDTWPASSIPVTVLYNQSLANKPSLKDAGDFAITQMNTTPGTSFRMTSGGTTSGTGGSCEGATDGQNTVSYADTHGAQVLGLTCSIGTTTTHRIVEADVIFNPTLLFSVAGTTPNDSYDLVSVVVHEFGHFAGLDHPCSAVRCGSDAVMEPELTQGQQRRRYRPDDVMGLNAKYPSVAFPRNAFRAVLPVLAGDDPK